MTQLATLHRPEDPVIIGVGQLLDRDDNSRRAPHELMAAAAELACADAGVAGSHVEAVAAVPTFSWRYRDPGRLVAEQLGASGARTWYATVGGNTPQMLLNRLARSISHRELSLAVLCGGESVRTRNRAKRNDEQLDWPSQSDDVAPDWHDGGQMLLADPAEVARGIVMPTQTYPLFENALWHESGRSLEDHLAAVGELWAGFSRVAADNPYAWRRTALSADEITTPTSDNRLVGFPYTKRMVSNPDVNMASGVVICSAERADALGVPRDKWVFVHSGTDGNDRNMSHRRDFVSSPAIGIAGRRALELAGFSHTDEVDHLDLYSCFPSAVQLALAELEVDPSRQLTVYGGLGFAGGPWNNPVGHAIASMVTVLRDHPGASGLVTANGGTVDKHSFGVYSSRPPAEGFRWENVQDQIDQVPPTEVAADHTGAVTIETWTVMHDRDNQPERAHCACRTPDGARCWAVSSDPGTMKELLVDDPIGRSAVVDSDGNLTFPAT